MASVFASARWWWLVTGLLLSGCSVNLPDEPGLGCDTEHPCRTGRVCVRDICVDVAGDGGSPDGGK